MLKRLILYSHVLFFHGVYSLLAYVDMMAMIMLIGYEVDVAMSLEMICSFDCLLMTMMARSLMTMNNEHAEVRMPLWTTMPPELL